MVNIGFLYDVSDTSYGYTEISSDYRNRLILGEQNDKYLFLF